MRQVLPGDRYLICSDGLSGVVSAETIGETLREYADPQQCVERLVQLALRGGGPDNITVIVADATDQDIVEAAPIVGGAAARDRGMATLGRRLDARPPAPRPRLRPAARGQPGAGAPAAARPATTSRTPAPAPGAHRGAAGGAARAARRRPLGAAGATPSGSTTSAPPTTASSRSSRACPGEIAGLDLSSVHETSGTQLDDLTTVAQERVKQGIQADDEPDAQRRLAELTSDDPANPNLKPILPAEPDAVTAATPPRRAARRRQPAAAATGRPHRPAPPRLARRPPRPPPRPTPRPSDPVPPVIDPAGCRPAD